MNGSEPITYEQWMADGKSRFGDDFFEWAFECPICKNVAKVNEYKPFKDKGATPDSATCECIGRYREKRSRAFGDNPVNAPCDYAGYGLFRVSPVKVLMPDGETKSCFAFAAPRRQVPSRSRSGEGPEKKEGGTMNAIEALNAAKEKPGEVFARRRDMPPCSGPGEAIGWIDGRARRFVFELLGKGKFRTGVAWLDASYLEDVWETVTYEELAKEAQAARFNPSRERKEDGR